MFRFLESRFSIFSAVIIWDADLPSVPLTSKSVSLRVSVALERWIFSSDNERVGCLIMGTTGSSSAMLSSSSILTGV